MNMQSYETREDMIKGVVPVGGVGCEIGVYAGEFAEQLMRIAKPNKLILIDGWDLIGPNLFTGDQDGNNCISLSSETLFNVVTRRFSNKNVEIMKALSHDAIPKIQDELDWVYIDADHSYEGCLRDLLLIEKKIKPNGLIMGYDFEMNMKKAKVDWETKFNIGVGRAVKEFCNTRGWKVIAKGNDGGVSFSLKRISEA